MKRCWSDWLRAAAVRAVRTMAQTALAMLGTEALLSSVQWTNVGRTALLAGALSLLTSLTGLPECRTESKEARRTAVQNG